MFGYAMDSIERAATEVAGNFAYYTGKTVTETVSPAVQSLQNVEKEVNGNVLYYTGQTPAEAEAAAANASAAATDAVC